MLYPTTCVGFGYGPSYTQTNRADFLGSLLRRGYHAMQASCVLSAFSTLRFRRRIYLLPSTRYSVSARTLCFSVSAGFVYDGLRNIDRMSIHPALTGGR